MVNADSIITKEIDYNSSLNMFITHTNKFKPNECYLNSSYILNSLLDSVLDGINPLFVIGYLLIDFDGSFCMIRHAWVETDEFIEENDFERIRNSVIDVTVLADMVKSTYIKKFKYVPVSYISIFEFNDLIEECNGYIHTLHLPTENLIKEKLYSLGYKDMLIN